MTDKEKDKEGPSPALTAIETDLTKVPVSIDDLTIKNVALVLSHRPRYLLKLCTEYGIKGEELRKMTELVKSHNTDLHTIVKYWKGKDHSLEQIGCALALREMCLDFEGMRIFTLAIILRYLRAFHNEDGFEADEVYEELQRNDIVKDEDLRTIVKIVEKHPDITHVEVTARYERSGRPILKDPLEIGKKYNVVEGRYEDD